jgi:hypothetical protein
VSRYVLRCSVDQMYLHELLDLRSRLQRELRYGKGLSGEMLTLDDILDAEKLCHAVQCELNARD